MFVAIAGRGRPVAGHHQGRPRCRHQRSGSYRTAACQPVFSADHHEFDSAVRSATAVGLQRVCCGEAGRSRASIIPAWAARGTCVSSAFRTGGCHCVQSCRRAHRGRPSWWGSYERAVELDPSSAPALAGPAEALLDTEAPTFDLWAVLVFWHKQRVRIDPDLCI